MPQALLEIIPSLHAAEAAAGQGLSGAEFAKLLVLGFSVLALAIIVYLLLFYRKTLLNPTAKWLHLMSLCVIPVLVLFIGNFVAYEEAKEISFCGSCHPVMDPYVNDLKDLNSNTLSAIHIQNRYITEDGCYACHVGYGIHGTMKAKRNGLLHLYKFYTNTFASPIKLYEPFSNSSCLKCHAGAKKFEAAEVHSAVMTEIVSDSLPCLGCHAPAHPVQVASKKPEGKQNR